MTVAALAANAQTREQASEELKEVREQIQDLKEELEKEGRRRSRAERALAEIEKNEQKVRGDLATVRNKIKLYPEMFFCFCF